MVSSLFFVYVRLMLGSLEVFNTIVALAGLGISALIWFRNRTRTRRARLRVIILVLTGTLALMWWWSKAGWDKWNILMSVGTVLAVVVALFLDDIRSFLHFREIDLHVGKDLLDIAPDFDFPTAKAHWIRGRIRNVGAHFVAYAIPFVTCSLQAPGIYTLTVAVYGDNIESREHKVRIAIGEDAKDIQFPRSVI